MADPSVMFSQPNAGAMFAKSFQQAQEAKKQNMAKAAYAELARNPSNAKAFEMLLQVAPEAAMQFREQALTRAREDTKAFQGTIQTAAEMLQRVKQQNPEMPDEQAYQMVRSTLVNMGAPGAEQAPAQFDPQYVAGIMALAGPPKEQSTEMQRNYEFLKSQNPDLAEQYLRSRSEGAPQIVTTQDGRVFAIPRSGPAPQGGPQPGHVEDGYRFKGGNPADKNNWEPVGGPTPSASGVFPPSGN